MPRLDIVRQSEIVRTARVIQLEGLFDVPRASQSTERWSINFDLPEQWNIGLIVGPSGSGKSTVAKEVFGSYLAGDWSWPEDKSLVDGFPQGMSIKDIVALLSSVGFSSPPAWLRPFSVLSNGEQFRASMARTLAEFKDIAVVDEFTSVVDRTVAQIGSAAVAKTVRKRNQKFVAVSCHYDIADWLEPDWVYQPHTNEFHAGRYLHQRPKIELAIRRVHYSAWEFFKKHHYLSADLNKVANCFVAFIGNTPVAFQAWLHFVHPTRRPTKRISRTVVLPDYQGVGIGSVLTNCLAATVKALGFSAITTTAHPGRIASLNHSSVWRMTKQPTVNSGGGKVMKRKGFAFAKDRLTAAFEYCGPATDKTEARLLWNGD